MRSRGWDWRPEPEPSRSESKKEVVSAINKSNGRGRSVRDITVHFFFSESSATHFKLRLLTLRRPPPPHVPLSRLARASECGRARPTHFIYLLDDSAHEEVAARLLMRMPMNARSSACHCHLTRRHRNVMRSAQPFSPFDRSSSPTFSFLGLARFRRALLPRAPSVIDFRFASVHRSKRSCEHRYANHEAFNFVVYSSLQQIKWEQRRLPGRISVGVGALSGALAETAETTWHVGVRRPFSIL